MKLKAIYILLPLVLLTLGCKKFLNVTPINEAYEESVFKERSGFISSLASVYSDFSASSLYGKEMKFGFLETLTGSYIAPELGHRYYGSYNYHYEDTQVKTILSNVWGQYYISINQLNIILKNISRISTDPYQPLIKGESLGLRAFAHFELLKYFGPVISQDGVDALAIPYRDTLSYNAVKPLKVKDVIAHINSDLKEARALLENDPIRKGDRADNNGLGTILERYNSLLDRRGIRMNYYGIVALQSMVAQWMGDQELAGKYAKEVIDELAQTKSIRLAENTDLNNSARNPDLRFAVENIFGLHVSSLRSAVLFNFPEVSDNRGNTDPLIFPNYTWLYSSLYNNPFHGTTNDFRLANWFSTDNTRWKLVKFHYNLEVDQSNQYAGIKELKLISLYNLYLLAAESQVEKNPQAALSYVNAIRRARGIDRAIVYDSNMSSKTLYDLIFDEFRKENIAEGTLFAEYKRKFKDIDRYNKNVPASKEIFCLPIPNDELIYNPF